MRDRLIDGGWAGSLREEAGGDSVILAQCQRPDIHVTSAAVNPVLKCSGVSLHRESSAMLSTSQYMVSPVHYTDGKKILTCFT